MGRLILLAAVGALVLLLLPFVPYLWPWETMQAAVAAAAFCTAKPLLQRSQPLLCVKSQYKISCDPLKTSDSMAAKWAQKTVVISPQKRGCHLITPKILKEIEQDLSGFTCGLAHLFIQHTSASLTINENYDSDVQADTETFLNRIVPEEHLKWLTLPKLALCADLKQYSFSGPSAPWTHTLEGPDDMPAHIKSSMFGCSLMIPITDGRLNMGTWQGIWLCEHRDHATPRKIVVTLNGV